MAAVIVSSQQARSRCLLRVPTTHRRPRRAKQLRALHRGLISTWERSRCWLMHKQRAGRSVPHQDTIFFQAGELQAPCSYLPRAGFFSPRPEGAPLPRGATRAPLFLSIRSVQTSTKFTAACKDLQGYPLSSAYHCNRDARRVSKASRVPCPRNGTMASPVPACLIRPWKRNDSPASLFAKGAVALLRSVHFDDMSQRSGFSGFVRNTGVHTD